MRDGDTPLIDAVRRGRAAELAALLAGGADVNEPKTDGTGCTALYVACEVKGRRIKSVKALIAAKADVNQASCDSGITPLSIACANGHTEIVTKLLAANAMVGKADEAGCMPLFIASNFGATRSSRSSSLRTPTESGYRKGSTPLYIACEKGHKR